MVVGLVLRLVWVAYAAHHPVGLYDPARYLYAAEGIAHGKGYIGVVGAQPTAYYPPGYPYFLGAIAWLVRIGMPGGVPVVAGVVQALLGTSVVATAAVVARRVWSPAAAGLAAWLVALEPNLIFHSAALLSETLFLALFMAALAVLCAPCAPRLHSTRSTRRVVWFAVLFALAFLVRPVSAPVLVAVMAGWWLASHDWRAVLRWTAITVAVLVVFLAPWAIRNAVRMHAFIPVSTNTGDNFCIGNEPHAYGGFGLPDACNVPVGSTSDYLRNAAKLEVRHDKIARKLGWHYFTGHLGREPWLLWRRADITSVDDHDGLDAVQSYCTPNLSRSLCQPGAWQMGDGTYRLLAHVADWYWYVIGVVGGVGVVLLLMGRDAVRRPERVMVALATVGSIVVLFAFFGNARFKVPAVPLLCVTAAAVICRLVELLPRVAERRSDGGPPAPVVPQS